MSEGQWEEGKAAGFSKAFRLDAIKYV